MGRRAALAVLVAAMVASAASAGDAPPARLLALTPESVAAGATVKDDALEVEATITTEPAAPAKRGWYGVHWNDTFLRVFVAKKTGAARYQVYQRIAYVAGTYREYETANVETLANDGPASVELLEIARGRDCKSTGIIGGCIHREDVAFGIDEALLRKVAARYRPDGAGDPQPWRFRFKSRGGVDVDAYLMPAEVAGALLAVDRYRKDHGLPS